MVWYLVRGSKVLVVQAEDCVVEASSEDPVRAMWVRVKIKRKSAAFRVGSGAFLVEDDAKAAVVSYLRREVLRYKRALATAKARLKIAVSGGRRER